MKFSVAVWVLFALLKFTLLDAMRRVGEPLCTYRTLQGETISLKYLPMMNKGQQYIEFDDDGLCSRRAVCTETFRTDVDLCADVEVNCSTKFDFAGIFPGCCIRCPTHHMKYFDTGMTEPSDTVECVLPGPKKYS